MGDDKSKNPVRRLLAATRNYSAIGTLIDLGKFESAERELDKLLKDDPNDYSALLLKGMLYNRQGRLGTAVKALQQAIKAEPNDAAAHAKLGDILVKGLNAKRGIAELEKAVSLEQRPEDKARLGFYLHHVNRQHDRARTLMDEARAAAPENATVNKLYFALYGKKEGSRAVIHTLVKKNPEDIEALNILAKTYMEEGKYKEAAETYKKILVLEPTDNIKQTYKQALKFSLLIYRPQILLNKHGIIARYAIFYGFSLLIIFASVLFGTWLVILIPVAIIYTWVVDPIAEGIVRWRLKNDRP